MNTIVIYYAADTASLKREVITQRRKICEERKRAGK
jgi:hypothetical protein